MILLVNSGKTEPIPLLRAEAGHELVVITEPGYGRLYPSDMPVQLVDDIGDLAAVEAAAMCLTGGTPPAAVVSPSERSLPPGAYLRAFFGIDGMDFTTASRFTNKFAMKRRLRAAGVAVADFALVPGLRDVPAAADALGWPVVVKQVVGTGSINAVRLRRRDDLAAGHDGLTRSRHPLIVERWVDMDAEYHCDAVVWDGAVLHATAARYFEPLLASLTSANGSYTLPEHSPEARELLDLHRTVVAALGLRAGVTHLEAYRVGRDWLLGEVAARPAGGGIPRMVSLHSGVDLWRAFVDIALGRRPVLDVTATPGVTVNCQLPVRLGRVVAVPAWDAVRRVPGVVAVEPLVGVGDVLDGVIHSSRGAAQIYLRLPAEADVQPAVAALAERFSITTVPA